MASPTKEDIAAAKSAAGFHPADSNGDGHVSKEEEQMYLEFKRKELEDADAMRDAQRKMAWFSLSGMLLYPAIVLVAVLVGVDQAAKNSWGYGSSILCFCCCYCCCILWCTSNGCKT